MRVLAIIPARGGSKGVPRKNIRLLAGRPLLAYTADAALNSQRLSRVILSTDDEEIAAVGRACGLEVPFLRPKELARDDTPTLPVLQHAVGVLDEMNAKFDAVCLLQPTNPLRTSATIDACLELLETTGADSVATVLPVPLEYNPHWVYFRDGGGFLRLSTGETTPIPRRQLLPEAFRREGSVYAMLRTVLMDQNSLYGVKMVGYQLDSEASVNIDTMKDWSDAEAILSRPPRFPASSVTRAELR
jgi:CMP-N,N'-diacetyllegionaminic acid synthase